jgi:hypothetical protein
VNISSAQNKLLARKLEIFIHPEFNYTSRENDIAVIQMDTPITPDGSEVIKNSKTFFSISLF